MADTRSKEGSFQWAIKTGDVKGVQDYIEKEKIDLNKPDTTVKKRTPLHYAADFGQGNSTNFSCLHQINYSYKFCTIFNTTNTC